MTISQVSIFLLTFLVAAVLVILIKSHRNLERDIVVYFIGHKDFENPNEELYSESGKLHVTQVVQKVEGIGNLTAVHVEFPKNGQGYKIMLVKVVNFNSQISTKQLVRQQKDDKDFWVLVSDGAIGSDSLTIEINSFVDIDADVEFYGYKDNDEKATTITNEQVNDETATLPPHEQVL